MLRTIYTFIFALALPVVFYRLWVKDKKVPGYRIRWPERFGIYPTPPPGKPIVWIHAVSVGEVVAATPIIKRLLLCSEVRLMVTTMTPTGSTRVLNNFGDAVLHVYAPYDLPWTVAAFLRRTQPVLAIIMETELWPNILHECSRQQLPLILANARMSERSAKRYLRFRQATKSLLNCLNFVAAQNQNDGERFLKMGLQPEKLLVSGNVKFDTHISDNQIQASVALKCAYGEDRPLLVAASTHEGEDHIILAGFSKILRQHPTALLILVPRHPERFNDVVSLCQASFRCVRRSEGTLPSSQTQVIVGDTMGEMNLFYGLADIAFVGGSLIERGGHNMIEPASWGVPVLSGPHTFNFADVSKRLLACEGMYTVLNEDDFAQQCITWLDQPSLRLQAGQNAKQFAEQNRGAVDRLMTLVSKYIPCQ